MHVYVHVVSGLELNLNWQCFDHTGSVLSDLYSFLYSHVHASHMHVHVHFGLV